MMHGAMEATAEKKRENKVIGFNVRILDDGSYMMRTSNKSYEHEKEYSFTDMDSLTKGIKMVSRKIGGKMDDKMDDHDELDRKSEKD